MRFIIHIFLLINSLFAREIIDLHPEKKGFYSKPFSLGNILFDSKKPPMVLLAIDYSVFNNYTYIYKNDLEKFFHINSEVFITLLQHFKFKNNKSFYFIVRDISGKNSIKRTLFLIDIKEIEKYNNRDFGENDKKVLSQNGIKKYQFLPIYQLFKTFKIVTFNNNKELLTSSELTKKYHEFLDIYYSEILGEMENKIMSLQEEKKDLKTNIWLYCTNGNMSKIKLYKNLGFDLDAKDPQNCQTCLQYASVNGHYKIVKFLIDNGADPNIHKEGYENAYLAAKRRGYTKIAKLLKPITKMTQYPSSSYSNYNSSDLKNMCLGASGKYPSFCYKISNNDLKNSCLAMRQYPNFAYKISNNDLKNFTLGANGQHPSLCYKINNSDLKNACLGINNNISNCYNIKDKNIQNICLGIANNSINCYNIK